MSESKIDPNSDHIATRSSSDLGDGRTHGFEPLEPLDLHSVKTFSDLTDRMKKTAFGGRALGEAVDTICEMAADDQCTVVATFSGAMTIAKMGLLICDMVDAGIVNAIVSTGALICHGLVESFGMSHFKAPTTWSDTEFFDAGYCRVYDTIELEQNLDDLATILRKILASHDPNEPLSSSLLCNKIGAFCNHTYGGRSILGTCEKKSVPVFVPAFSDSELGIDYALLNRMNTLEGKPRMQFDPFIDFEKYVDLVTDKPRLGIITIGGGVPRNWAQQVGPYVDSMQRRLTGKCDHPVRFTYGVRICPEPVHWGGLSGCTYSEGVSWGKFVPPSQGGKFAEVLADATVALPLILMAALERLGRL